jgi:hypothetical protein
MPVKTLEFRFIDLVKVKASSVAGSIGIVIPSRLTVAGFDSTLWNPLLVHKYKEQFFGELFKMHVKYQSRLVCI